MIEIEIRFRSQVSLNIAFPPHSHSNSHWITDYYEKLKQTKSMFDFEKLNVFHNAKLFNKKMHEYLLQHSVDQVAKQQFMSWEWRGKFGLDHTIQFKH